MKYIHSALVGLLVAKASATTTLFTLTPATPFSQDWSDTSLIAVSDDWSGVPSIVGYRGDDALGTGVDPQTVLTVGTNVVDVNANQTAPNSFTTGGVAEFELTNPTIALQGSGTGDVPNIVLYLDASGAGDITVSYLLRDIDGSTDNAIQQIALQYRIGASGDFINVPAAFVTDASTGPSLATLETPVSVLLPSSVNGAGQLEVRIITANAVGNDEWIGIDNISVVAAIPEPSAVLLGSIGLLALLRRRR